MSSQPLLPYKGNDDDILALSGIQHFIFCKRQWALIHIEQAWSDNLLTVEGDLMHERAHDDLLREHRGNIIILRGLSVRSYQLGLSGKCDVVEFHSSKQGHPLVGEDGLWLPYPVEYKRGREKKDNSDSAQLCAQAICLEEMFACEISEGSLYYGEKHSRKKVLFDDQLREIVEKSAFDMHKLYRERHTPNPKASSACRSCSLEKICLSRTVARRSVDDYIVSSLSEESA